jgi:hypothetical protein
MLKNRQTSHICRKKHKFSVKTDVSNDPTGRITGFSQAGTATVSTPLSNITFTYDANGNRLCYSTEFLNYLAKLDLKKEEAAVSKSDAAADSSGAVCGDGGGTCGCGGSV